MVGMEVGEVGLPAVSVADITELLDTMCLDLFEYIERKSVIVIKIHNC